MHYFVLVLLCFSLYIFFLYFMLGWERDLLGRIQRTTKESQPNMEGTEESNNNNNRPQLPMQNQRTMREFLNPPKLSTPSCFMLPPNQDHVTI